MVFQGTVTEFENATITSTSVNIYNFVCSNKGIILTLIYNTVNGIFYIDSYCGIEIGDVIAPLDLMNILVVNFSGTMEIFTILAIVFIAIAMAYVGLPNVLATILFALFALIMFAYAGWFFILVITIGGILTFVLFSRIWK